MFTTDLDLMLKLQRLIYVHNGRHQEFIEAINNVLLIEKEPKVESTPVNSKWPIGGCTDTSYISCKVHSQLVHKLKSEGYNLPSKTNIDDSFWNNKYVGVNEYGDITHYSDSFFFTKGSIGGMCYTADWVQHYLKGIL